MKTFRPFSAALILLFSVIINATPITLHPLAFDYTISSNNTINSTSIHHGQNKVASNAPATPLPLTLTNNFNGGQQVNAYVTGTDGDGSAFFLQANGSPYYPPNPASGIPPTPINADIAIPLQGFGSSITVNLPNYITSGRIYFSVGTISFAVNYGPSGPEIVAPSFENPSDPNADTNYGFVEFTWTADAGIYSNLSYVDFVGLVISQVLNSSSNGQCVVKGLPSNAVTTICNALTSQSAIDGQPWGDSCQKDSSGNPIRVLAPLHLTEIVPNALANYYTDYINQVWTHYTTNDLIITAGSIGNFTGRVDSSGQLTFDQGGSFSQPQLTDILGCNSGPFANEGDESRLAIVPRLCAAFVRSTLLLPGGNIQPDGVPVDQYYSVSPTDQYSRIVHANEVDGKGYAFPYDDVTPPGAPDVSGLCNAPDPLGVTYYVGGPPSYTK